MDIFGNKRGYSLLSLISDEISAKHVSRQAKHLGLRLNVPTHLVEFILLIEDKRFALHFGLDPIAIVRSLLANLSRRSLQGGSTIPQQLYNTRRNCNPYPRTVFYK